MYLVKRTIVFVILIISVGVAYSQQKKSHYYSWDLANLVAKNFAKDFFGDTTLYIYTDSNTTNGLTIYTDSIRVDISNNDTCIDALGESNSFMMSRNDRELLCQIHYPITLTDNPLFKKAVYHNDDGWLATSNIGYILYHQEKEGKKGFFILSYDGKYINYALLEEKDGALHAKYSPLNKGNSGIVTTIKKKELRNWITQKTEANENTIISIIKNGNVYIAKVCLL